MKKLFNHWQWLAIVLLAFCIASPAVYGAGGSAPGYWGEDGSAKGDEWKGEIFLVGQIADPSKATVSPDSVDFTELPYPYDPIVSGVFVAKLANRKLGLITCSGPAYVIDAQTGQRYSDFHAIGDRLGSSLFAEALQNFLQNEVKAALTSGGPQIGSNGYLPPFTVVLKEAGEEWDNATQLSGGLGDVKSPLFLSLKVTVVVP